MVGSLAERLRAHEQQKARLAGQEATLETAERKACTRQPIEAGGPVDRHCDGGNCRMQAFAVHDNTSGRRYARGMHVAAIERTTDPIVAFAPIGPARASPTHNATPSAGMWNFFAEGRVIPGAARWHAESPK